VTSAPDCRRRESTSEDSETTTRLEAGISDVLGPKEDDIGVD
jgi:hypothetical protein